jgi:hypothetical protein
MAHEVANKRVLYLEFGVFQGDVTRHWSKLLTNPESHLHGFDSFEGLPESWPGTNRDKGHFSTNGNIPEIADPRVKFFKGWFEQTLPTYEPPEHDVLVVNLDADLYSSTAYVLSHISPLIKAGTLIYFDEFNHRDHELRAFDEFRNKCKLRFSPFVASTTLEHIAFRANLWAHWKRWSSPSSCSACSFCSSCISILSRRGTGNYLKANETIEAAAFAPVGQLLPWIKAPPVPEEVFRLSPIPSPAGEAKFPNGAVTLHPVSAVDIADTTTSEVPTSVTLGALHFVAVVPHEVLVVPVGTVSAMGVVELGWYERILKIFPPWLPLSVRFSVVVAEVVIT